MSGKIPGAVLILAGAFLLYFYRCRSLRKEVQILKELQAALEDMETMVRWKKIPLPQAMKRQTQRPLCGICFSSALKMMKGGVPLQDAWERGLRESVSPYIREILCRIEWNGDEQQIIGNLRAAQKALIRLSREKEAERLQREKISLALMFSGAGLMILILI